MKGVSRENPIKRELKDIVQLTLQNSFVTITEVATFITTTGLVRWQIILGLIIGGVSSSPGNVHLQKASIKSIDDYG